MKITQNERHAAQQELPLRSLNRLFLLFQLDLQQYLLALIKFVLLLIDRIPLSLLLQKAEILPLMQARHNFVDARAVFLIEIITTPRLEYSERLQQALDVAETG